MQILAIETSCDETAAAVVEKNGSDIKVLSNVVASQINIHKKFGGVFPEHASRAHVEKIIPVVEQALEDADMSLSEMPVSRTKFETRPNRVAESEKISRGRNNPDIIAVTTGPGLIGSLLIGVNFAKTFAYAKNIPIIRINHWLGHIYSNFTTTEGIPPSECRSSEASRLDREAEANGATRGGLPQFPALILIVSGGHTGLVLMKSHDNIETLGETLDDAAGEAFDKVAKLLDLGYPGGPAISKAAEKGDPKTYDFPRSMLSQKNYNFSFSGLKTAVLYESKKLKKLTPKNKADFAASFQQATIDILIGKTIAAAKEFKPKSICLCGGVSANKELREHLKKAFFKFNPSILYFVPPLELTGDNATMIGIAAAYHLDQKTTPDNIQADSNLKL